MNEELIKNAVKITKQREGILNSVQDSYIESIIKGVIKEIEKQNGIKVDLSEDDIFVFVVDLASYRYSNRDSLEDMPTHLYFRLKNLYINQKNDTEEVQK